MAKFILILLLSLNWSIACAEPLKQIVFFGDSLTDNGNLYKSLFYKFPKSPPYFKGRFSNGPVWADYLEIQYNSSLNYATGGATAIWRSPFQGHLPYSIKQEINSYLTWHMLTDKSKVQFVLWIGANDYLSNQSNIEKSTTLVVDEISALMKKLIKAGARHLLVFNIPDLAITPYAKTVSYGENLHALTDAHNKKLVVAIERLKKERPDVKITFIDINSLLLDIMQNTEAYNKKYNKHIRNTTDACWTSGYTLQNNFATNVEQLSNELQTTPLSKKDTRLLSEQLLSSPSLAVAYSNSKAYEMGATPCDKPNEYLFWDLVHPSAEAHELLASVIKERLLS